MQSESDKVEVLKLLPKKKILKGLRAMGEIWFT